MRGVSDVQRPYDTGALAEEPGERVLWIYDVQCRWSEPHDEVSCTYCKPDAPCFSHRDAPAGRKWNSSSGYRFFREPTEITVTPEEHWPHLRTPPTDPRDFSFKSELVMRETWALTWFEHAQPDWGDDDAAVLASFERYIERVERYNRQHPGELDYAPPICLMGAEDRWRWHGASPDGESETRSEPPCRCKFCKERGVVRIGH